MTIVSTTKGANTDGVRVSPPADPPLHRKHQISYIRQEQENYIQTSMAHEDVFPLAESDEIMVRDQYIYFTAVMIHKRTIGQLLHLIRQYFRRMCSMCRTRELPLRTTRRSCPCSSGTRWSEHNGSTATGLSRNIP